ncbi:MAG: acyloxyacyl hydrolase [Fimbriimonas sp.]
MYLIRTYRPIGTAVALALFGAAFARSDRSIGVFVGQGLQVLGSEDPRSGGGIFLQWSAPDRRLSWRGRTGKFVRELYIDGTRSRGASGQPANSTWAIGAIGYARYEFGNRYYVDLGLGVQYANRRTVDLDSLFNTTPCLAVGWILPGQEAWNVGFRFLHVSNGGSSGKNQGQNFLALTAMRRF